MALVLLIMIQLQLTIQTEIIKMGNQKFISKATEIFSQIDTSAQFITIHNYKNNFGEVATHSLTWRINYTNAIKKSIKILKDYTPSIEDCIGKPYTIDHVKMALGELLESFYDTVNLGPGNNPRATSVHAYDSVLDKFGKKIPGVMIHRNTDTLHLNSIYRIHKIIHTPGMYPTVNSALKTIAKDDLRAKFPLKKFGQFKLDIGKFERLVVQKISLFEEDMMRADI